MPGTGSWTSSWPASRSWCTSEAPGASRILRLAAAVRLTHPFPSLLNAVATTAIASLAGAAPPVALRLGVSMLALQASIGALNDAVDAAADSGRKPGKPIPRGLASPRQALLIAGIGLAVGLGLSAPSGLPTLVVAVAGVGCGYLYDLVLKPTALSWLPLVVALPLVPVHAWLGATGTLPPGLTALVSAAVLGGATLAIANGLVDVERDRAAGRWTIVARLGHGPGWVLHAALAAGLALVVVAAAPRGGEIVAGGLRVGELALVLGLAGVIVGAALLRHRRPGVRERGWELEALGVAGIGVGWLAGAAGAGS